MMFKNSIDLNDVELSEISLSMSRSAVINLDGFSSEVLIVYTSGSKNNSSPLHNIEPLSLRAFQLHPIYGLQEISSDVFDGEIKSVITRNLILGDYDGNGTTDIFLNNHGTEITSPFPGEKNQLLLNIGGKLSTADDFNVPEFMDFSHNGSSGDYNNDGYDDLFIINFGSSGLNADYVLFGSESGFSNPIFLRGAGSEPNIGDYQFFSEQMPASVSIDSDQDGTAEIIGPARRHQEQAEMEFITISVNTEKLVQIQELGIYWAGSIEGPHQARSADLNNDGFDDGLFFGFTEDGASIFQMLLSSEDGILDGSLNLGDANGVFDLTQGLLDFKIIDFDLDNDLDILLRGWSEDWHIHGIAFENDGNGVFEETDFPYTFPLGIGPNIAGAPFDIFQSGQNTNLIAFDITSKLTVMPVSAPLAGNIKTRSGDALSSVIVSAGNNLDTSSSTTGTFEIDLFGIESKIYGSLNFDASYATKAINSSDALDALKLAVGLPTAAGTKSAFDFIAADFNQDGKLSSQDALSILKYSVGLATETTPHWLFLDGEKDYSEISRINTVYAEGILLTELSADTPVDLIGILVGDVNDSFIA